MTCRAEGGGRCAPSVERDHRKLIMPPRRRPGIEVKTKCQEPLHAG